PDAAGGAQHRERLAALERGALDQRVVGGAVDDGEAGRANELEVGRKLDEPCGFDREAFACRPIRDIADDAVARRQRGHAIAHALDRAAELAAGRERERRLALIAAGDDQRVIEVEPDRGDAHDGFAGPGRRIRDVGEFEIVGTAEAGAEDGFHGAARFDRGLFSMLLTVGPDVRNHVFNRAWAATVPRGAAFTLPNSQGIPPLKWGFVSITEISDEG